MIEKSILDSEPHQVTGRLYDAGIYPILVLDERETLQIRGELLTLEAGALRLLDALEGYEGPGSSYNLYERVLHPENFFVYTWSQQKVDKKGLKSIISGDWLAHYKFKMR